MEFVECPMLKYRKISVTQCEHCPGGFHRGVMLRVQVETKDPVSGARASENVVIVRELDFPIFRNLHADEQLTPLDRYVQCDFPRHIPLDSIET